MNLPCKTFCYKLVERWCAADIKMIAQKLEPSSNMSSSESSVSFGSFTDRSGSKDLMSRLARSETQLKGRYC